MISPEFRATDAPKLSEALKTYITKNYGDGMWNDLQHDINGVELVRSQLAQASAHKTDCAQLTKFKELFFTNYKNMILFNKYFIFGTQQTQLNLQLKWRDSFDRKEKKGGAFLDAVSSLYNYGVCCARIACFMDLKGDGVKEGAKSFMEAAAIFEHLRTMVTQLQPSETSVDFTAEAMSMNSNLMLAQAQYLFLRKATEAGMAPTMISKIAMQVAEYFKKAYEFSQVNNALRTFDNQRFANVLKYHSLYFEAMAYYTLLDMSYKEANNKAKGMGRVAGLGKVTIAKFEACRQIVSALGGAYAQNYNAKLKIAVELTEKAVKDNKSVYYEKVVDANEIKSPDLQNFVKLNMVKDLNEACDLDERLRHLVPPQVRALIDELKNILQGVITEEFNKIQKTEEDEVKFLRQFNLPDALFSLTAGNEVPASMWAKIEEFQKKGSAQNFQTAIEGCEAVKQSNMNLINEMNQILEAEEQEDNALRAQNGSRWTAVPSASCNGQYKQSLFEFNQKMQMAAQTDQQIVQKFQENKQGLDILAKTKAELAQMIPQSQTNAAIAENAVVVGLKKALEELDAISKEKEEIMNEGVQMNDNLNPTEDLMKVFNKTMDKHAAFEKYRAQYVAHFAKNEALENRKKEINQMILQNGPQFGNLCKQAGTDPARQQFFAQLDAALVAQEQLQNMLSQGGQFYAQLGDILMKLKQSVNDYKMSRELQKNELLQSLGQGGNPPPTQQQPPVQGYGQMQNFQNQPNPYGGNDGFQQM